MSVSEKLKILKCNYVRLYIYFIKDAITTGELLLKFHTFHFRPMGTVDGQDGEQAFGSANYYIWSQKKGRGKQKQSSWAMGREPRIH